LNILFIKKFIKITLLILCLTFVGSTILAFYHFGIEQGFFNESFLCKDSLENLSKDELLKELQKINVNCKDVDFRILGLSIATINAIFSFCLSVIFIKLFNNYEKNR
jgi:disulfide bond formation protein DsbB